MFLHYFLSSTRKSLGFCMGLYSYMRQNPTLTQQLLFLYNTSNCCEIFCWRSALLTISYLRSQLTASSLSLLSVFCSCPFLTMSKRWSHRRWSSVRPQLGQTCWSAWHRIESGRGVGLPKSGMSFGGWKHHGWKHEWDTVTVVLWIKKKWIMTTYCIRRGFTCKVTRKLSVKREVVYFELNNMFWNYSV